MGDSVVESDGMSEWLIDAVTHETIYCTSAVAHFPRGRGGAFLDHRRVSWFLNSRY